MQAFIYGVPGTGKTYLSKEYGKKHNLEVIEGGILKKIARKRYSKADNPYLYFGTCSAYKLLGDFNEQNVIKGLISVRKEMTEYVLNEIRKRGNFILEGAFLDPNILLKHGKVILLVSEDEKEHRRKFRRHLDKLFDFNNHEFKASRIIQQYLLSEADALGVDIIHSDTNIDEVAQLENLLKKINDD